MQNKTIKSLVIILTAAAALSAAISCSTELDLLGMFWTRSETPDVRFEQSLEYSSEHPCGPIRADAEEYKVYALTDCHVSKTTANLDKFVSILLADRQAAPFSLFLGDLVNGNDNFPIAAKSLEPIIRSSSDTLFSTPGNHDIFFGLWKEYAAMFKTASYTFEVVTPKGAGDFFLCMDSASGTLGSKQLEWVRSTLEKAAKAGYRHIVVFTHTHFFKEDSYQGHTSNYEMEETYELLDIFSRCGVDLVLTGHRHTRDETIFGNVRYVILDSSEDSDDEPFYSTVLFGPENIIINHHSLK